MQRVRAKAHLELARIGSRVAIQDLQSILADSDRRLPLEALSAVEQIGKKDEIPLLLSAYLREDPFTRGRIAGVVRTILKRERIRRNSVAFRARCPTELRRTLESILARVRAERPATASPLNRKLSVRDLRDLTREARFLPRRFQRPARDRARHRRRADHGIAPDRRLA